MFALKIVAGVLLVLFVAFLLVRGWFRHWIRRKFRDAQVSALLVGDRYLRPARIRLQRCDESPEDESLRALWSRCHALGFRKLGGFEGSEGVPEFLVAAVHDASSLVAALVVADGEVHYQLFVLTLEQRLLAISDGPGETVASGSLRWQVEPGLDVEMAFQQLVRESEGQELRPIDLRLFRTIYERAYARRADATLVHPPQREWIAQRAAETILAPSPVQIDQAHELAMLQWQARVSEAVLDQFCEVSRIDAITWERIRDDVHVVHGHLRADDVKEMLVEDEASEFAWRQLTAQGLEGIELYRALLHKLPRARHRTCLREVRIPLRALIFGRDDTQEQAPGPEAGMHHYEALGRDGRTVRGALIATDSGDAKRQLEAAGMSQPRILLEPTSMTSTPDFMFDEKTAALAARSAREPIAVGILRALAGNFWLWLPPSLLLAWTWREGAPFGWGDYLVFAYAAISLLVLLVIVAPAVLFHQAVHSRMHARWRSARLCLALLARLNFLGALDHTHLRLEGMKVLAGQGHAEEALMRWRAMEAELSPEQYLNGLVQLHDASGDRPALVAAQRALLAAQPHDLVKVDLAMSLARESSSADEAESLLSEIDPQALSELALAGYQYARGLVALSRDQHAQAINHFQQAVDQVAAFRSNPLVLAMVTEINGYVALAMKRLGELEKANSIWGRVRPFLGKHPSCSELIATYESPA